MPARKPPARKAPARQPGRPPTRRPGGTRAATAEPRPFLTPGGSAFRHALERRSATILLFLGRLPRAVPALFVVGLVALALMAPPVAGSVALLLIALLLGWLVFLSWPGIRTPARAIRVVVIAIVVAYAAARLAQ
jgi:hypothetical protein